MDLVTLLAMIALGAWSARQYTRGVSRARLTGAGSTMDPEAEVAVHVAQHEARSRGQALLPLHLLYGLLQDEAFVAALRRSGGDPEATEDRVGTALDRISSGPRTELAADHASDLNEAYGVLAYANALAQQHRRPTSCTDLWNSLIRWDTQLGELGTTRPIAVLVALVHGDEPAVVLANETLVHVVLRNDDYTTREFVVEMLRDVFELGEAAATATMTATHETGRAVVGRYPTPVAKAKVESARERARASGFPLWVGVEPC